MKQTYLPRSAFLILIVGVMALAESGLVRHTVDGAGSMRGERPSMALLGHERLTGCRSMAVPGHAFPAPAGNAALGKTEMSLP